MKCCQARACETERDDKLPFKKEKGDAAMCEKWLSKIPHLHGELWRTDGFSTVRGFTFVSLQMRMAECSWTEQCAFQIPGTKKREEAGYIWGDIPSWRVVYFFLEWIREGEFVAGSLVNLWLGFE